MRTMKVSQVCVLLEYFLDFKTAGPLRLEILKELELLEGLSNE